MAFLKVSNLWMSYGEQVVLERINLEVQQGQFCTMVGASGCGKSTFLRLLLGQERPTKGNITLAGQPLVPEPDASRGIVFQKYSVLPHLTVLDNVALALELPKSRWLGRLLGTAKVAAREEARAMLDKVGLAPSLGKYPHQLSGGMQQRLAIAQALMGKPRVLLLDEPFGALDPGIRKDMHHLLQELWHQERLTVSKGFTSGRGYWCSTRSASTLTPHRRTALPSRTTFPLTKTVPRPPMYWMDCGKDSCKWLHRKANRHDRYNC